MPHGSCSFKNSWLHYGAYKFWVCISPLGKNYAGCNLFNKYDINLAAIGKSALVIHQNLLPPSLPPLLFVLMMVQLPLLPVLLVQIPVPWDDISTPCTS